MLILKTWMPILFVICSCMLTVDGQVRAAEPLLSVAMDCQQVVVEWAFDPENRRIFANSQSNEIIEYGAETGEVVRRFPLKSYCREMLWKPGKLFVCSRHGLQVIDLTLNQPGQFLTDLYGARSIMSPSASSNHAYLFATRSRQHRKSELVRFNTETLKVELRQAWGSQTKRQTPSRFVVSRNEKHLLSLGFVNPLHPFHQGRIYGFNSNTLRLSLQREVTIPALPLTQITHGERWLAGNTMLSTDLKESLREYSDDFVAFDESRDRFATLTLKDASLTHTDMILSVGRISSNEELARLALSAPVGSSRNRSLKQSSIHLVFPTIQFDRSGQWVLCAYASSCHVVNLQKLGIQQTADRLKLEPLKTTLFAAGLPIAIDLQVKGAPNGTKPTLSLTDAPAGARIQGTKLIWNPTFNEIGHHDVRLNISAADMKASHLLSLNIALPEVALSVDSQAMITDEVGKYAVVFGQHQDVTTTSSTQYRPPSHLAVVDLTRLAIVQRHSVSDWPRTNLISGKYLFWIPKSVDVIKRINLEQESEVETLKLPEGNLDEIFLLGNDLLAVVLADEQKKAARIVVYQCEDWQAIDDHPLAQLQLRWYPGSIRNELRRIGDAQLYFYGRVLDETDGSRLCFNTRIGTPASRMIRVMEKDFIATNNRGSYGNAWGVEINSRQIERDRNPAIIYYTSKTHQLSRSKPLYVSLEREKREHTHYFVLELRDLVSGKTLGQFPLPDDVTFSPGYPRFLRFVRIAGDKIVCVIGDRLFYHRIPDLSDQLQPLRMLYPKTTPTRVTEVVTIPLVARGGKTPYRFRLGQTIDGVTVDSSTGKLKIRWPTLWRNYRSTVAAGKRYEVIVTEDRLGTDTTFNRMTGIEVPAGKIPVSVECLLDVSDASGQQDRVLVSLIGIAPKQELIPKIRKGKKAMELRRAKAKELQTQN